MSTSVGSRGRHAATRLLAEQLEPVLHLHRDLYAAATHSLDLTRARDRIARGHSAFDPATVIRAAGKLGPAFERCATAFEEAGMAATATVSTMRGQRIDARAHALAWAVGEPLPTRSVLRLARRVAGVVASAVLRRASDDVLKGLSLRKWTSAHCPCCGGPPDLALASAGSRTVICARCDARWTPRTRGCLSCGADSAPTLARIRSPYLGYDLVICNACGRYLKERTGKLRYDPVVERALTAELDAAAERRGLRF